MSECLSSGCKNLESNSLLVVFRRIKRNIRTRTFLNLVPIFTLKCTSALSCFLREKGREICVSFEQRRKERSGKRFFKKENRARFLKNNPRRKRRRRRRERLKTRTAETTPTTTKTNLVLHFQVYVFAFVFFLFFFGIHFISRKKQM